MPRLSKPPRKGSKSCKIVELFDCGMGAKAISAKLGITRQHVYTVLYRYSRRESARPSLNIVASAGR